MEEGPDRYDGEGSRLSPTPSKPWKQDRVMGRLCSRGQSYNDADYKSLTDRARLYHRHAFSRASHDPETELPALNASPAVLLRSLLFVPGNRADMLEKAPVYPAHAFIPDLEDSVPAAEKASAREVTAGAIQRLAASGRPVIPRVNSLPTGLTEEDINAVVTPDVAAISIGKVNGPDDIRQVESLLKRREIKLGLQAGSVGVLPWIETAQAVLRAEQICVASPRVRWVAFGAEDFSADMGIARSVDLSDEEPMDPAFGEPGLLFARSAVAIAARAAGIQALDTPYVLFRDADGLRSDCLRVRRLGFRGKMAIHPAQIETIKELFAPSADEIARARKVLEAAEAAEKAGRGSVSLDGEMIDAPVVARAKNVLRDAGVEWSR